MKNDLASVSLNVAGERVHVDQLVANCFLVNQFDEYSYNLWPGNEIIFRILSRSNRLRIPKAYNTNLEVVKAVFAAAMDRVRRGVVLVDAPSGLRKISGHISFSQEIKEWETIVKYIFDDYEETGKLHVGLRTIENGTFDFSPVLDSDKMFVASIIAASTNCPMGVLLRSGDVVSVIKTFSTVQRRLIIHPSVPDDWLETAKRYHGMTSESESFSLDFMRDLWNVTVGTLPHDVVTYMTVRSFLHAQRMGSLRPRKSSRRGR